MRVTFPGMGDYWVFLKSMFRNLDAELVIPPAVSQRTLSLGVKHSPETVCLPFKLSLGSIIEGLEAGADAVMITGHYGPCRFGYYHKLHATILRELGYRFRMINEDYGLVGMGKQLAEGAALPKVLSGVVVSLAKLKALDEMPRVLYEARTREREPGTANRVYKRALGKLDEAGSLHAVSMMKRDYRREMRSIPGDPPSDGLRIGITGEIYLVLEPFANMQVEAELGKLGVEVRRSVSLWEFVYALNPLARIFGLGESHRSQRAARPYLAHHVGGDGLQSVGEKVLHARDWDGIVHLEPFGCLPEVMARNIMPVTREDIPVLNLVFDEHTGKAGIVSRLEAFVDMIRSRKRRQMSLPAARQGRGD